MAQSLSRVLIHVIFSTHLRAPLITPEIQQHLWPYLGGIARELNSTAIQVGGAADHLHALLTLPRTISISDLIKEMKTASSPWIKEQGIAHFAWQAGYGAFSVSESNVAAVVEYIKSQPEHHRARSFEDEYRAFLTRHGISFDERYVWE